MEAKRTVMEIVEVLEEMGLVIEFCEDKMDFDLREYVVDSLEFVSFIMEIEQHFEIEIPSELLIYDNIKSTVGFANMINELRAEDNVTV